MDFQTDFVVRKFVPTNRHNREPSLGYFLKSAATEPTTKISVVGCFEFCPRSNWYIKCGIMAHEEKSKRDVAQNALRVVEIATGGRLKPSRKNPAARYGLVA